MSETLIPKHPPYTAQELIDTGWVSRVRSAIVANGNAVRAGKDQTIQGQVINDPARWMPILLPNRDTHLTDSAQCLLVIDMLEGKTPIPEPPKKDE
jgi:hypothetical protein